MIEPPKDVIIKEMIDQWIGPVSSPRSRYERHHVLSLGRIAIHAPPAEITEDQLQRVYLS